MSLLSNDPITQLSFSLFENKGIFAVLLGSGLSRAAEIPTGWEITIDLIRRIALAQGAENQQDWVKWYHNKTGKDPSYSALLEDLASSPGERRAILHNYIEPSEIDLEEWRKIPTVAHHAIAALVRAGYIRVIITTNFDRLIENALRDQGIEPTVIASPDALSGAEPLTHSACYLLKLHGDYKDARILNTDSELNEYPDPYNTLLDRIFDEHGLIVCGWSGEWDHALRSAFLRAPNRRYPIYWTIRNQLNNATEDLVKHRKARVIPIAEADTFFTELQQRVETLEQNQRQNPFSVELLLNSVKRYLAKPEYRIQLDELFTQETDRMIVQMELPEFAPQGSWSKEEFRLRIQRYESAAEPLAKMVGILGRWGDDSELRLVLDIINTLYSHAENSAGGGLVPWLNIRSYPAVLVFTAYGIGLTRAQRWSTLHTLFTTSITREHYDPKRVVDLLFLEAWEGGTKELWENISGFERRHTPFSDYLLALFTDWGKSFSGLSGDFVLLYERFECLASLAYFEREDAASMQAAASANDRELAWMPIGRVGWDKQNLKKLIQELQTNEITTALLQASFAKANSGLLELFVDNLIRHARRMY